MDDGTRNDDGQSNVNAANAALARGWIPIPITATGKKRPLIPYHSDRSRIPTSGADVWTLWGEDYPDAGVAVLTGPRPDGSGLLVIDVDVKDGQPGPDSLQSAQLKLGKLPQTFRQMTPSGGWQLFFSYPDDSDTWRNWQAWRPGIDVRGWHGIVGAPGSTDPRGEYKIFYDYPIASLPTAWLDALAKPTKEIDFAPPVAASTPELRRQRTVALEEIATLCARLAEPGPGKHGRLVECATIAGSWSHLVGDDAAVHDALLAALRSAHVARGGYLDEAKSAADVWVLMRNGQVHPKWTAFEGTALGNIADYGLEVAVPAASCPPRSLDDLGNAHRLADHAGEGIAYATDAGLWLVWDAGTGVWSASGGDVLVQRQVQEMLEALPWCEHEHYSTLPNTDPVTGKDKPSDRDLFYGHVAKTRNHQRMRSAIAQASSLPALAARMADFDSWPMLLAVANGTLELESGKLRASSAGDRLTMVAPVSYDPLATSPLWEAFLLSVQPDPEVRAYLARVVGYTLTGSTAEQKLWIHHGTGANGKSVFVDTLARVLGTYAQAIPRSTLLAKTGDAGVPNDLARMRGKRMLRASETAAGRRLDGELVKELTGGEEISAREMRASWFDFRPVGKVHLTTNHVPQLGADDAIRRRLETVPWAVVVPREERDPRLVDKLALEAPGILSWAVAGCLEWQRVGLATPPIVTERTDEHLALSDVLADWIETCLERVPGAEVELSLLYGSYEQHAKQHGERPMVSRSLAEALTERDFRSHKDGRTRRRVFDHVRILPSGLEQAADRFGYPRLHDVSES